MSGAADYTLTAQDNVDAAHAGSGGMVSKLSWAIVAIAFLFPVIDLWAGLSILRDTAFFVFLGTGLLFLAWDYFARDWAVRRQFKQSLAMRSPIHLRWDAETIGFRTDTSNARYRWDQFHRWRMSPKSILLYRDSQMFIPVPRRALSEADAQDIAAALRAAGVPGKAAG